MGLFTRQSPQPLDDDEFANIDLPTGQDLDDSFLDTPQVLSPARKAAPNYTIEDAIALMQSLPKGDAELIVTVVQQTLESLDVVVGDIITDAETKEKRLNNRHEQLKGDIQSLQAKIEDRNQQIETLLHQLKDITNVKQQLQTSQKSNPPKPAAQKATTQAATASKAAMTKTPLTSPASTSAPTDKTSAAPPKISISQ